MNVMRAQFAVLYLFLCSIANAEHCVPFQNCKDGRITSAWNESSLVSFSKSDSYFRMQVVWKRKTPAIYSTSNRIPDDCGHEYSVELTSEDSSPDHKSQKIAGFVIQACADGHPMGKFVSLETDTGWKPAHCLEPQDTAIYSSTSPRKTFLITWTLPCTNKVTMNVVFRYAVLDSSAHFHGPMEYSPSQLNPTGVDLTPGARKVFLQERVKRASPAAHLVFASQLFIQQLSLDGTRSTILASGYKIQRAVALDFHYRHGYIFWSDVLTKTILRSKLDGSMITTILETGLNITDGLAVDWVTDKLYWTDAERKTIGVFDLGNQFYHGELISTGSDSTPRSIAVDPQNRWMYWTDWGTIAKIEKASMDGRNRSVIHNTSLVWPNGLTLDYSTQVLYWADANLDKIESSNVDGSNRRVLVNIAGYHPFGITLFEDTLYFSDWIINGIRTTNKSGGQSVQTLYQTDCSLRPYGVQVFSEQRQPQAANPCGNNNGNCSHLCLLSVRDPRGFVCACPEGMALETNQYSCNVIPGAALPPSPPSEGSCVAAGYSSCCIEGPCQGQPMNCFCDANCRQFGDCCNDVPSDCLSTVSQPYILFARRHFISQLSLDGNRTSTAVSGLTNAIALDFDYRRNRLFWTDVIEDKIWMSQLDGSGALSLVESGLHTPGGAAVDWISNKLYWTDAELKTVDVLDLSDGYHATLISTESSSSPRAIVVDPQTWWMYWTDWGTIAKIEKASMDGRNRSVIHNTSLVWPNGLTLDYSTQVLYWADANLDKIESSNVDGSNRRVLVNIAGYHPFGITLFEDTLYFSDWLGGIFSADKSGGQAVQLLLDITNLCVDPFGIQVVTEERQPQAQNPCGGGRGPCSHLCLLSSVDPHGFSCVCPHGMSLEEDQRNCTSVNVTTPRPTNPGSCRAAGYTTCCTDAACEGEPQNCFCDALCHIFQDCCHDATEICPPTGIVLEFHRRPENISVIPSRPAHFQCSVHATDPTSIVWQYQSSKNSPALIIGDETGPVSSKYSITVGLRNSVLTVHNVTQSDQGIYICMATAGQRSINASAQLGIIVLPVVTGNDTFGELATISLSCSYAGSPQSTVIWLKRDEEEVKVVLNSSRVSVTIQTQTSGEVHVTTSILVVHNVSAVDSGEYLCEVMNGVGQVSSTVSHHITVTTKNECRSDSGTDSPCQHGGSCVDLLAGYECLCTPVYTGINCSERVDSSRPATEPNITSPPENITAQLVQPINLTCEADGYPAPTYKWYKDGQLIPGETLPYLYIPEASPESRGSYSCEAVNPGGQVSSNLAQIAIPGVYQYKVQLNHTGITNIEDIIPRELLGMVGTTLLNSSASIYSIQVLNTSSSFQGTYIFTVNLPANSGTPTEFVRGILTEQLQSFASFQVIEIVRYDGCPRETRTLILGGISYHYTWQEVEIGITLSQLCPCQDLLGSQSGSTFRQCTGAYSNGGSWSQVDFTQCAIFVSEATRHLCENAVQVTSAPLNVSRNVVNLTMDTENLIPTVISAATFIVEQLTQEAVHNPQVRQNYLQICDNLQLADGSTLLSSQVETNSSSRLLSSLTTFADEVETNTSTNRTLYALQSFALQVQDVDATTFAGEAFSIDLGSVEEATNITNTIAPSALVTMMETLSNATASLQLSNSVLSACENQRTQTNYRLSYSVFRSNGLFQTRNTNNSIGSIIIGARLGCAQNAAPLSRRTSRKIRKEATLNTTLQTPVQLQFRTSQALQDESGDSSCVHWDTSKNGGFGAWSMEGCREVYTNNKNEKYCECTQLAHFGILFDLNPKPPQPAAALVLSVITYIGLSISLLCLFAFIVTYLSSKKLRTSIHGQILINLSISLVGLYIFFLTGAYLTSIPVLCGISSALLHYFMLVFFGWTAAEAILLYVKLVVILGTQRIESKFVLKAALATWLVPLVIVAISAGAGHDYYINPFFCRATQWPFWFGLILPFALLYIFNWVMFIVIMVSLIKHSATHGDNTDTRKLFKRNFIIAVGLAIVFGLGWGLGLTATSSSVEGLTLAFQIIFTIFVALQGVLIFAFHGIRNKDAKKLWKDWFSTIRTKSSKAYSVSRYGRSENISSVTGKGSTLPPSTSTDSTGFSTLGRPIASKKSQDSLDYVTRYTETKDMSSPDTAVQMEMEDNPAYGEVKRQQQGNQQASPQDVEGKHEHNQANELPKTELPPEQHGRKRSWLQSIVSPGKPDYEKLDWVPTPPPERKEFVPSEEAITKGDISDQQSDHHYEAIAQPRKPRRSRITPFSSQSHIYEALPESTDSPPPVRSKKPGTRKLSKFERGSNNREKEATIDEGTAEDSTQ